MPATKRRRKTHRQLVREIEQAEREGKPYPRPSLPVLRALATRIYEDVVEGKRIPPPKAGSRSPRRGRR